MEIRPLTADDIRMIDALILLRRMALLAWIGSHAETALAQAHAERFALDTAHLARKYLDPRIGRGRRVAVRILAVADLHYACPSSTGCCSGAAL